jgi:hypothetical protein
MTGRGAGFCAGYAMPGYTNPMPGRGMGWGRGKGRGFGMGMGWRHGWAAQGYPVTAQPVPYAPQDEMTMLKNQAQSLGQALETIKNRINELETERK